jgi:hypothetical protein
MGLDDGTGTTDLSLSQRQPGVRMRANKKTRLPLSGFAARG